jgi:predicted PurR-regulated permease PerM
MPSMSGIVTAVLVVASLYFAREVLIPLALAVLISFILTPLVVGLRRIGVPRGASVALVVTVSFTLILGAGAIGTSQIVQLANSLPQYQSNLEQKVKTLSTTVFSRGALSHAADMIKNLSRDAAPDRTENRDLRRPSAEAPIPVRIESPRPDALEVVSNFILPVISPLVTAALVVVFVIFFLAQREDVRDRVIRVLGTRMLHRTTEAMGEAAARLSRYLFLLTMLSAAYGTSVGVALWLIGIPSPWLWGIFAMLMRYVPFVGSFIAAIFPVALAAAVDPGWSMVVWTVAIYLIGEPLMGNFVEPVVLGPQTGLSPVAILVAATFWTWLWGPIGLILATPLTFCLVILGQYVRPLEFLYIMLGDQPPLTPAETVYQRLIAGDPGEVLDQAERQLKESPLPDFFDQVMVPALELADRDVRSGELSSDRQLLLADGIQEFTDNLVEHEPATPDSHDQDSEGSSSAKGATPAVQPGPRTNAPVEAPIFCFGGGGAINHAAAALLARALSSAGLAPILPNAHGFKGLGEIGDKSQTIRLVCVCLVGPVKVAHARFLVRRLRRAFSNAEVLLGVWGVPADASSAEVKAEAGADLFAATLAEAVNLCVQVIDGDEAPALRKIPQPTAAMQNRTAPASAAPNIALPAQ